MHAGDAGHDPIDLPEHFNEEGGSGQAGHLGSITSHRGAGRGLVHGDDAGHRVAGPHGAMEFLVDMVTTAPEGTRKTKSRPSGSARGAGVGRQAVAVAVNDLPGAVLAAVDVGDAQAHVADRGAVEGDVGVPALGTAARVVPVRHGNETLGAITLEKPANDPLTSAEDGLLRHLASQAGLVLRNTRLTADLRETIDELRASRRRLVEAQDAERRKIERNLHDGAQQQLVALTIQLSLLADAADDPELVR